MTGTATDAAVTEFAAEMGESEPVAVEGGRTRWAAGGELADGVRVVRAPSGVLDYQPEEMTVRVRAATTVRELHDALAERGQRTALPERGGTVGGALAVGENDLDVMGHGTVRSALLQVTYVAADGRLVSGGGPTVKNVSGFDLPRLIVGALGTLGFIAEVILRTNPVPPESRWLTSEDADPLEALAALYRPAAVLWDGARTWVHLEGYSADVDAQQRVLGDHGSWAVGDGPPELPAHRWSVPPADLRDLRLHDSGNARGALAEIADAGPFVAEIGVGTVHASVPQPPRPVGAALRSLHDRIKAEFDPTGRLNPGRDPVRS